MSTQPLVELLNGKGSHANPLACVEDVSFAIAARRDANLPHSIWQLVSHMNYWMDYELRRIHGENPPYPAHASESWPLHPAPASEADWNNSTIQFKELLAKLASLATSTPDILAREVQPAHPAHTMQSSSVHAVLWQTLVHNSYHVGQIAMLRRMLGAWPPKGGGDSW